MLAARALFNTIGFIGRDAEIAAMETGATRQAARLASGRAAGVNFYSHNGLTAADVAAASTRYGNATRFATRTPAEVAAEGMYAVLPDRAAVAYGGNVALRAASGGRMGVPLGEATAVYGMYRGAEYAVNHPKQIAGAAAVAGGSYATIKALETRFKPTKAENVVTRDSHKATKNKSEAV